VGVDHGLSFPRMRDLEGTAVSHLAPASFAGSPSLARQAGLAGDDGVRFMRASSVPAGLYSATAPPDGSRAGAATRA